MPHKLLLADDSVTIQRVIELTFADEDVQVIAVGNGQDAIDRVQRDPPDIVLADAGMPERNGYEVAAFIKGQPAYAHIPVVLLTGAFEPVDEGRARSVGCDGVLVKPFEPQIVISRVKELLAGRQPAGMWGGAPASQGPVRQAPPAPAPPPPQANRTGASGDSLEAYFDHLDAAFSAVGTGEAPPPTPFAPAAAARRDPIPLSRSRSVEATAHDPLSDWDPDLHGDPSRPAAVEAPIAFPQRATTPDARPASPGPVAVPPAQTPPPAAAPMPVAAPVHLAAPVPVAAPPLSAPPMPASLVDAFAALLAAEQKIGLAPSAATVPIPASAAPSALAASTAQSAPAGPPTEDTIDEIYRRVLARLSDESRPTILDVAERLVREEIERIKQSGNL
jgi:CheY-like chemotaxis protein